MQRSLTPEIMDGPDVPESTMRIFHRDLKLINSLLGNMSAIVERLKRDPPRNVLDIGCGGGALLDCIRKELGATVIGVDLRVPADDPYGISIAAADATRDPLPQADAAVSMLLLHHLSEAQVIDLIRNTGKSCRRFICLDLVRHPLPIILFTVFICPFVSRATALDGRQSIRRAFTPAELRSLAGRALEGTGAAFEHWVSPVSARQIIDITYQPASSS
ncbi:MAG: methyltransferase domain-containing protein [Acidobacteriota bacterium]|nr:methyltransferase domain-containing protein [Acidobacteriota bacterium]